MAANDSEAARKSRSSESSPGLFVEALASREPSQLLDQLGISAAVGRAHPDVDAASRPSRARWCGRLALG
jgi:hypothetical protein